MKPIKQILIVGGGSAGWMTAATLAKLFPNKKIKLIESPNIKTVGVGESTISRIRAWCALIGLKDKEFIKATDASIKLSIKFTDFRKKGESFHYPFGRLCTEGNTTGVNDWWFKKEAFPKTPLNDYADCMSPQMALVNANKYTDKPIPTLDFNYQKDSAFHFDATKFGIWLRDNICKPNGVKHIKEEIRTIEQNEDGILSLNKKHKADLYIDCTGFKSMLLEKTLKEPFENLEHMLPNNSAWATRIPYTNKKKELNLYTNCTAYNNGWIWNIPLWSRMGTGYVYSDKFISDDDALKEFKTYLGKRDLDFKKIKMRVGIQKRLWVKNVVAIGLSAGFIEPLESNGLYSVHEFLFHLSRTLRRDVVTQYEKDAFSFACKHAFYVFAEFVAMHYALSQRTDTPYWKANFNKTWDDGVVNLRPVLARYFLQAAFNKYKDFKNGADHGFSFISAGMDYAPADKISLMYENVFYDTKELRTDLKQITNHLNMKKNTWNKAVAKVPLLYDYLKQIHEKG